MSLIIGITAAFGAAAGAGAGFVAKTFSVLGNYTKDTSVKTTIIAGAVAGGLLGGGAAYLVSDTEPAAQTETSHVVQMKAKELTA